MSSSKGRVGGVEPETVTCYLTWICEGCDACAPLDGSDRDEFPCTHDSPSVNGAWVVKAADHASALRLVEEELRQAREREGSLNRCIDALEDRGCAREGELMALEAAAVEHEDVKADRDRLAEALDSAQEFIETVTQWTGTHPDEREEVLATIDAALSPVQGEHEQDGEARIYVTASEARLIGDAYFTGSPDALDRAHDVIARLADAADGRGESEPDGDTDA